MSPTDLPFPSFRKYVHELKILPLTVSALSFVDGGRPLSFSNEVSTVYRLSKQPSSFASGCVETSCIVVREGIRIKLMGPQQSRLRLPMGRACARGPQRFARISGSLHRLPYEKSGGGRAGAVELYFPALKSGSDADGDGGEEREGEGHHCVCMDKDIDLIDGHCRLVEVIR